MSEKLISKDMFNEYSKYCLPILLFIVILLIVLLVSFNNLATTVITTVTDTSVQQISQVRYDFVGVQLLNFTTFLLACVLPIVISLIMGTYEKSSKSKKSKKEEVSVEHNEIFSNRIITGSLYIVLPFLLNAFIYIMLIWSNYFGTMQSEILIKLLMMTIFGIALSLLTFMLMTVINMALRNATVDALLTLAVVLFIVHVFYYMPINPIFLIVIIFFVWLALIYLGKTLTAKKK